MTDSNPGEQAKCDKCGAPLQLDGEVCVSCLLRQGLESDGDVSKATYATVLDELDGRDKPWQLGNYEILEQIGCGGMGVIYRARQRHSRRIVAIKRVLSYRADSHGALQRFRREAQAVASLDHANILPIYEVSESEDGLPFFSMKLAEKGSLHENAAALRDQPAKCVELMAKVARAVEYAHSRGVFHRDIKPGNILLSDRGEPLVSDFGLAKLLDGNTDLTRSLTTFGTAGFIAPEQAGGAAGDFTRAADVYSLGAVLFNLLAGRPPFLGNNPVAVIRQASETPAPKLRALAPALDRDLETICARCLERDPDARYRSAGDVAADLERWIDGRPIVARPVAAPARIWRWSRRNPKLVGAATAGLLLGAAAVWIFRADVLRAPALPTADRSVTALPVATPAVIQPIGVETVGISLPVANSPNSFAGADQAKAVQPKDPPTELTARAPAAAREYALDLAVRKNKVTADATTAPSRTGLDINLSDHVAPAEVETKPPDKAESIQGFVKDAKGEPIKGVDVRIESRDGKQAYSTVKTDAKGRYVSQGLPPGVYRVTLVVNGSVAGSTMKSHTGSSQSGELNFELSPVPQAGKHMVWVPARTGSHIGGWVEVDDDGHAHSGANIHTVTVRSW